MIDFIRNIFAEGAYLAFDPLTIAALVTSVAGTVGSLAGSAKLNKQRQSNLTTQENKARDWYNKEYYQDEVDRSENQSALRLLTDKLKESNKIDQSTAAITGATPEAQLAAKEKSNKAYADTVTRIAGNASNRRTSLNHIRRADDRSFYLMQDQLDASKGQTWANLGANAVQLGGNALLYGGGGTTPTTPATPSLPGGDPGKNIVDAMHKNAKNVGLATLGV